MNGTGVIDGFLGTFTRYIDSGFGLLQGDVRWLAGVLIAIDITLAGLFWALAPDEDIIVRLVRKTLYIGVFAFIIGNYNNLAEIVFNSFAGLGLKAGGGSLSQAQLLQPGSIAEVGIDAAKPFLAAISSLTGYVAIFENFIQITILLIAWLIVVISFFVIAIQLFVSLLEFKLTTLAGFVLVPFGLFGRTAFLAEKVLGNVVSSGVKILVLAVIIGIGSTIFGQFTGGLNNPPTISDALTLILAALSLLGLSIFGPGIANGLIAGGPQLGAGAVAGTGLALAGLGAYGAGAAGRGAVSGVAAGAANVAKEGALAAVSPLRSAAAAVKERFEAGMARGAGVPSGAAPDAASASGEPAWAVRMRRRQTAAHGASATRHALRSGDSPSRIAAKLIPGGAAGNRVMRIPFMVPVSLLSKAMKLADYHGQTLDAFITDALHAKVAELNSADSEALVGAE